MAAAPVPPLPHPAPLASVPPAEPVARLRPPQVLLAVGVVLLVAAGVAGPALVGDGAARTGVLVLAVLAAGVSAWAGRAGLRSTEEACAAAAAALALTGAAAGDRLDDGPGPPLLLAAALIGLRVGLPRPLSWPLAAWVAVQVATLRSLDLVPAGVPHAVLLLTVAIAGLGLTLAARRALARIALLTTAPWWLAGVGGGLATAATAAGSARWLPAALTVAAAAGLLLVRLDRAVEPLLGPPRAVPVLAGLVAGGAGAAALSTDGPVPVPLAGLLGVYLVAVTAATLTGWRRGLLLPAAGAAGGVLVVLSVGQLVVAARWPALVLLLVLTALPSAGVAAVRRDERPTAVPTAVGCLAAAALLAVPAGLLGPGASAAVLTALFTATLAVRPAVAADVRGPTGAVGAACAAAALVVLAVDRAWGQLALHLAVQGALTYGWALLLARQPVTAARDEAADTRRVGAAELVAAAWTCAALASATTVEAWSLPAAGGLLLAAGRQLSRGPSWPAWGPGLVVAAVPSTVAAVVQPGALRPVLVLLVAAAVMASAARTALRAPLVVAAATAVALALGLLVVELPLPLAGVLVVGTALLVLGARRESRPVAGFGARLSEMR